MLTGTLHERRMRHLIDASVGPDRMKDCRDTDARQVPNLLEEIRKRIREIETGAVD